MLKNIGIIGEGKMGTNLLYYLLDMDFTLTWICSQEADPEKLERTLNKRLTRTLEAGIINEKRFHNIREKITISKQSGDLADCDLIIEAINEELQAKKNLFQVLDSVASSECILTSNSSSINPSDLVPSEKRKGKFAGLHFFYPIALKNIVEVIKTPDTSKDTIKEITSFLESIHRNFLMLEEKDSFILNRIFLYFQNEAFLLTKENKASILQIDRIVKDHFFPIGVFEFFDNVGLDIMLSSVKNYSKYDPVPVQFHPLILQLEEHVSNGRLGVKKNGGFYREGISYDPGKPENDPTIILKLTNSYKLAFNNLCKSSSITAKELKMAMDEYFGAETPTVY
ncbi:MAG: 3-hydroxyacyl-CoA dehydrogenase family protein [Bacteroidales bacterium]|jgi:3-hydroxybutyryl-CoA dehydrogenase